jgi:hypothetical protein
MRQCGVEGGELAHLTVSRRPALSGWAPEAGRGGGGSCWRTMVAVRSKQLRLEAATGRAIQNWRSCSSSQWADVLSGRGIRRCHCSTSRSNRCNNSRSTAQQLLQARVGVYEGCSSGATGNSKAADWQGAEARRVQFSNVLHERWVACWSAGQAVERWWRSVQEQGSGLRAGGTV